MFKKNEPIGISKETVHELRKEIREPHNRLINGWKDVEKRLENIQSNLTELTDMVATLKTDTTFVFLSLDKLLEKLEQ